MTPLQIGGLLRTLVGVPTNGRSHSLPPAAGVPAVGGLNLLVGVDPQENAEQNHQVDANGKTQCKSHQKEINR